MADALDATAGKPDYTALTFPSEAPGQFEASGRPYVIANMVMSADGKVQIAGTEQGIGSPTDQRLMRELRFHADVVVNGASTLRISGTSSRLGDPGLQARRVASGRTPNPIAAVLSTSGDLPLERAFFTARDFEAVVYLSSAAPAGRQTAIEATGRRVVIVPAEEAPAAMLRHMYQELGARLVLVEGGPTLNGALFSLGLVDEYFTTIGPVVVGAAGPLTAVEATISPSPDEVTRFALLSAHANPDSSEVYLRYRVTQRYSGALSSA